MDRQVSEWKSDIDRLWLATALDCHAAAKLAAEIAHGSSDASLQQAAAQALPSLRAAVAKRADRGARDLARRRLGLARDVLYGLDGPRFGKRGADTRPLSPEERQRQLLGLPLGRRLDGAEIHQAYKRVARTAHPDGGGNAREFHELSAAHDALMKER